MSQQVHLLNRLIFIHRDEVKCFRLTMIGISRGAVTSLLSGATSEADLPSPRLLKCFPLNRSIWRCILSSAASNAVKISSDLSSVRKMKPFPRRVICATFRSNLCHRADLTYEKSTRISSSIGNTLFSFSSFLPVYSFNRSKDFHILAHYLEFYIHGCLLICCIGILLKSTYQFQVIYCRF